MLSEAHSSMRSLRRVGRVKQRCVGRDVSPHLIALSRMNARRKSLLDTPRSGNGLFFRTGMQSFPRPRPTRTSAEEHSALVTRFATADNPWYALILLPVHLDQGARKITDRIQEVAAQYLNIIGTEECHGVHVS